VSGAGADRWDDDDQLLADIGAAIRQGQEVPADFVALGEAAFLWHDVDAELAAIVHDSADGLTASATRADEAGFHALTFVAGGVTIEVEVTAEALLGQVVPPRAEGIELQGRDGSILALPLDEVGSFAVRPGPAGLVRLRVRPEGGAPVVTQWFVP
jgi:hypothetical protein